MSKKPTFLRSYVEIESQFQVRFRRVAALTLGLAWLVGCAPSPLPDGERRVALRETTEQVILPTYADLSDRTAELAAVLEELAAAPEGADLRPARAAYLATREPLQEAEAFGFGPAEEPGARAALDQWPIDAAKVEAAIASDQELTSSFVRSLGANKRGLHAVEYLLFPEDDAEVEAALLSEEASGERRREFAALAARIVAGEAEKLRLAWSPEDGDYAGSFSRPGEAGSVSPDVQAGLDTMLNQVVVVTEVVANAKLGKPLGLSTGKVSPEAQESERAGASLSDMLANLRGVRNVYFGSRDGSRAVSLSSLVHAKSPGVDARVAAALEDAEQALREVPEPFTSALVEQPKKVQAAYDAVKALKRVLATEALGTLGASLKFSDNDGD